LLISHGLPAVRAVLMFIDEAGQIFAIDDR